MSQRFFIDQPIATTKVVLAGSEAQHLSRVMRGKVGDAVVLFDGTGHEYVAAIEEIRKNAVGLRIVEKQSVSRESRITLTVGVSLPKGDRQRWVVEKLTELGVADFVPLQAQRSVAQPVDRARDRLRRYVIEACKQCGRNRLMTIQPAITVSEFLTRPSAAETRMFAHIEGQDLDTVPSQNEVKAAFLAIGPEGGWTEEEALAAENAGWRLTKLGPRILRVETAAMLLASLFAWRS